MGTYPENLLPPFPPRLIRRVAKLRGPRGLPALAARQLLAEARLLWLKKTDFRQRDNELARHAYDAMTGEEFEDINALQCWSDWRSIPRNLSGRLPRRAIRVLDLCCGTGQSTEVLAHYTAPGSEIMGLDFNGRFVVLARQRVYLDAQGQAARVGFHEQSVLEPFRDGSGRLIAADSVDLINVAGAVGAHFDAAASDVLAREILRRLVPGGLALVDSGNAGTSESELLGIFQGLGFGLLNRARSCWLDRFTQLCLRKPAY